MDPRIDVRDSPIHGRGLFARESFGSGEVALIWGGTVFSEAEIQAGKANPASLTLVEEGVYLGESAGAKGMEDCLNHCCDSNLWMRDAITLVTRDVVEEDEELTLDYVLQMTDPAWILSPCRCGSPHCRGKATGTDWRLPELQERYEDHFSPLIQGWLETHGRRA
jgi:hypothetical protein